MATSDATNTTALPTFSSLKPFEQLAIELKAEGKTLEVIASTINAEFTLAYKTNGVREWFRPGGRLEQAYLEFNEYFADQAIIRAKLKIKKMSEKAADTLDELMGDGFDGRVRQQAAKTTLGKYVPDRQVVLDETKADEIPSAIGNAGDNVLTGEPNGQEQVADTPPSEPAGGDTGPGSS